MTRTERNPYPAAIAKDRHSRSGLNKSESSHKGGDGAHNWGSNRGKGNDEVGGLEDATQEMMEFNHDQDQDHDQLSPLNTANSNANSNGLDIKGASGASGANANIHEDVEGNIARSPTDSMSSLDSQSQSEGKRPNAGGRRMSNVSDEERASARVYREGALNKAGVDLAHIARTSYGIAQSPPSAQYLASSPTKVKSGFNFK